MPGFDENGAQRVRQGLQAAVLVVMYGRTQGTGVPRGGAQAIQGVGMMMPARASTFALPSPLAAERADGRSDAFDQGQAGRAEPFTRAVTGYAARREHQIQEAGEQSSGDHPHLR